MSKRFEETVRAMTGKGIVIVIIILIMGIIITMLSCTSNHEPKANIYNIPKVIDSRDTIVNWKTIDTTLFIKEDNDDSLRALYDRNNSDFDPDNSGFTLDNTWEGYYN